MQWAVDRGEAELALRIGSALSLFWYRQGWLTEGRKWLDRALALPSSSLAAPVLRLQALLGHGTLVWSHGDYETAERIATESYTMAIHLDHKHSISEALHLLGMVAIDRGDDPQWLYTVVFEGRELWGPDADPTLKVSIDAFEP